GLFERGMRSIHLACLAGRTTSGYLSTTANRASLTQEERAMPKLEGKVTVITGGSSGIGLATAHRFVKEGAYVYITGRRQSELNQAVDLIGHNVTAVPGDVQSLDDLTRLYARIGEEKGEIDVLVANSGFIAPQTLVNVTEANFDKTFGINVRGLLFTVQKALSLISDGGS